MRRRGVNFFLSSVLLSGLLFGCGDDRDATPPARVADLEGVPDGTSIHLTWTAVGDDGTNGTAESYDVRYATSALSGDVWLDAAAVAGAPIPGAPGSPESLTVAGLSRSTEYFFSIRVLDDAGLSSGWSNTASAVTGFVPRPFTTDQYTVALYHFDEETGGDGILDASGLGNAGVLSGATRVEGRFGGGLRFDGVDDYVRIPRSFSLDAIIYPQFTIEAWIKLNRTGRETICNKALVETSSCWPWLFMYDTSSLYAVVDGCTGGVRGGAFAPGEWHYVALVYTPNSGFPLVGPTDPQPVGRLYVDGVLTATSDLPSSLADPHADIYLGAAFDFRNEGDHLQDHFSGVMDEVRISKAARVINGLP